MGIARREVQKDTRLVLLSHLARTLRPEFFGHRNNCLSLLDRALWICMRECALHYLSLLGYLSRPGLLGAGGSAPLRSSCYRPSISGRIGAGRPGSRNE